MRRVLLDADAWAAIRTDYETSDEPVHSIARRNGMSRDTIYDRAAEEGWRMRSRPRVRRAVEVPPPPPTVRKVRRAAAARNRDAAAGTARGPTQTAGPALTHEQRLERLHRILDRLLIKLECFMDDNPDITPQEQEKAAKAVMQTVAALERVTELANTQGVVPETDGGQSHDNAEADRMRREIAERLERLSAKWLEGTAKPE